MNPQPPQHNQELDFIAKCQSIAAIKGLSIELCFSQMDPRLLNQILKAYSEKLIFLGDTDAEKCLQEALISLASKLKEQSVCKRQIIANKNKGEQDQNIPMKTLSSNPCGRTQQPQRFQTNESLGLNLPQTAWRQKDCTPIDAEHNQNLIDKNANKSLQSENLQMIVVSKEREKQYDQAIENQWKEARSNFYNHTIKQKLNQAHIQEQYQNEITQIFIKADQNYLPRRLDIKGELIQFQQQIEQLNQSFKLINLQYSRWQKESPAITQIIQNKFTYLRVISIQYHLNIHQQYLYQVSAYELFKVVHENRGLYSVTLKGVNVKSFKCFMKDMTQFKLHQIQEQQNEQWGWMKDFRPSKSLKLAINSQDEFFLTNKEKDICLMKALAQFGGMFQQLSVVQIKIGVERYKEIKLQISNKLQILQEQLKMIGKIKMKIKVEYGQLSTDQPFTMILQMLSSLTTIVQLEFRGIKFNPLIGVNRFLAMEQILSTIFQNNKVIHLKIRSCSNFPIFPTINTLQKIYLWGSYFRRQFSLVSQLSKNSPSLQSIICSQVSQDWRIEEQLFNQLQQLYIKFCRYVKLGNLSHSPSNIKHLTIQLNIGNAHHLPVLFSKLIHIISLEIRQIYFSNQLLSIIPSPHLAYLRIQRSNDLKDKDLKAINEKWPKLRYLILRNCPKLNDDGRSLCKFKELIKLSIDTNTLVHGHYIRHQLKRRGLRIEQ